MSFPSDLQIAQAASLKPLGDIAAAMGIGPAPARGATASTSPRSSSRRSTSWPTGRGRSTSWSPRSPRRRWARARPPPPSGSGRRCARSGKRATVAIRQPSMGPTFGIKGGAAGGGYSQVVPMEILNLHLTGDFHAVTAAHNLLVRGAGQPPATRATSPAIDPHDITWRRVLDVNDRALRNIVVGLGSKHGRRPAADRVRHHRRQRGDGDLRAEPLAAGDARSGSAGSSSATPATRQPGHRRGDRRRRRHGRDHARRAEAEPACRRWRTRPVLVHAGPFGNIAHGNSSVVADLIGIHGGEYLVTEAGFGADMGAERFFNIKCRASGLTPDAAVVVATVRALKAHSGKHKIVAGKPLPRGAARGEPGRGPHRRGQPAQADREHPAARGVAGRRDQRVPRATTRPSTRRSPRSRPRWARGSAVCTHFADGGRGARGAGRGRRGGRRRAVGLPVPLPRRRVAAGEDRDDRDQGLRRRRRGLHPGRRPPARDLRAQRLRQPAGLHREDAPVALVGRLAQGRADGLAAAGARGAGLGRRRVHLPDLRRHAHDAGPRRQPRPRTRSTSTPTEMSWVSSSLSP